ncbi:MAG TPA: EAL domain-containing protein, partial [Vicinamibacteria bacterium]|nr:EAL domain-containing protein [Vicinamibacteria bacterium]
MPSAPVTGHERRSPTPAALRKRDAIRRLKKAVAEERLELRYQPIVRAGDGLAAGVEALLKWRAAEAEEDSLTDLIWVAERSPVIFQLENWILERAFGEAATLPATLRVNVNLSAREFSRADLGRRLARRLRAARLEPARIGLEITETSAMHDLEEVAGQL